MSRHHASTLRSPLETVHAITGQHASRNLKLSELVGTYLESNQRPDAKGGGAYQINRAVHDVTARQVHDPVWSTRYMRSAYKAAVRKVGAAAFKADPERAAERAAFLAEKPAKDYFDSQGSGRVHSAFLAAVSNLGENAPTGLPSSGDRAPVVATGLVTDASKAAANKLYRAGLRGRVLVIAHAIIGSMTKGKYTPTTVDNFIRDFKKNGGHFRQTVGASHYVNADYLKYIGRALSSLKATGHPTSFKLESHDPGEAGTGGPSALQQGAIKTGEVVDSVGSAFKWFADPDHLIRVGFILLGFILVIVGLAKLSGATVPSAKV